MFILIIIDNKYNNYSFATTICNNIITKYYLIILI